MTFYLRDSDSSFPSVLLVEIDHFLKGELADHVAVQHEERLVAFQITPKIARRTKVSRSNEGLKR